VHPEVRSMSAAFRMYLLHLDNDLSCSGPARARNVAPFRMHLLYLNSVPDVLYCVPKNPGPSSFRDRPVRWSAPVPLNPLLDCSKESLPQLPKYTNPNSIIPRSQISSPAMGGLQIPRWLGSDPLSAWWLGLAPDTLELCVRFPNERNQGKQAHPV